MRKIVYTRPDGRLCVVHPAGEDQEQRAWSKLPPDAIDPKWIDESEIPADRTFRNAWKQEGGKIECDMAKAKEIALGRMGKQSDVAVAAATTPEELKAVLNFDKEFVSIKGGKQP